MPVPKIGRFLTPRLDPAPPVPDTQGMGTAGRPGESPSGETSALSALIEESITPRGEAVLRAPSPKRPDRAGYHPTKADALRARAFEMYLSGRAPFEIARALKCSHQHISKLAQDHDWRAKRERVLAHATLTTTAHRELLDLALAELRGRLLTRLAELNTLCEKGRLPAILAWLKMAGLDGRGGDEGGPPEPPTVTVQNDLSDRRQVTIVTGPPPELAAPNSAPAEETAHG